MAEIGSPRPPEEGPAGDSEGTGPLEPDVDGREYRRLLPIGESLRLAGDNPLLTSELVPFEPAGLQPKVLQAPVLPEPARRGEHGADGCHLCVDVVDEIWYDEHWSVRGIRASALPAMVLLVPRRHHDMSDLPPERLRELGPMLGRLHEAVMAVPGTGRVHLHKWGDGTAHLHWFALARPAGMTQMRGGALILWDHLLPDLPPEMTDRNLAIIAAALARDS